MRSRSGTSLVAFGAVGFTAAALWTMSDLGVQDLPVGRDAAGPMISITVELPTADGITLGADVRDGQQIVGRVAGMRTVASGASVTLSVRDDSRLPSNSTASVELPSALGNAFIRLASPDHPSQAVLRDGDVIPPSRTELGPQIESALATFGALMSRSGVDQLSTIVTELDQAFSGRTEKIRGLVDRMSVLTGKADEHQGEFDQAVALAAQVSSQFANQQHTVDNYLDAMPRLVAMLDIQRAKIQSLLASTTALAATANSVAANHDMSAIVRDAGSVATALDSYNDRLGSTLSSMNTFLTRIADSVKGDYMVFDGALDIPGSLDKLLTGGLLVNGIPISGAEALDGFLSGGLR